MDEFITINGDCYEWNGSILVSGYGRLKIGGTSHRVHRLAWTFAHGPIPEGMLVMHTCDNRRCVRVDHLRLGTNAENMADMVTKGRASRNLTRRYDRGDAHHNTKLSDANVIEVRRRFDAGGTSKAALAREYGVSPSLIGQIINGRVRGDTYT